MGAGALQGERVWAAATLGGRGGARGRAGRAGEHGRQGQGRAGAACARLVCAAGPGWVFWCT